MNRVHDPLNGPCPDSLLRVNAGFSHGLCTQRMLNERVNKDKIRYMSQNKGSRCNEW